MPQPLSFIQTICISIRPFCSHPLTRLCAYGLTLLIYIGSVVPMEYTPGPSMNDKLLHFAGFFALLISYRLTHAKFSNLQLAVCIFGYGVFIELSQWFLPYRSFSIADMAADAAGILVGLTLYHFLRKQLLGQTLNGS